MKIDTLLPLLILRVCPIVLGDNVDKGCEQFSNSKSSTLWCCLVFA